MELDRLELRIEAESKKANAELDKLISKLGQVSTAMGGVSGFKSGASINSTAKSLGNYTKASFSSVVATKSLMSSIAGLIATFYTLKRVTSGIGKAIENSMDYTETINLFQTTYKKIGMETAVENGMEWGSATADAYAKGFIKEAENFNDMLTSSLGLDPNVMKNYQAIFAQMTNSMGLVAESSINIAESFTMLGNDIASLWNIDTKTAMQKLQSGLAGQIRPLRSLGVDISQTSLEMTALKYGIEDSVISMSQAAKVQLRWLSVMDQTEVAFGDMAKTIDSPKNQLRILSQQWTNLSRSIGNVFLPAVSTVLPYINAVVIALRNMIDTMATAMGYEIPDYSDSNIYTDVTGDIDGMTDSTEDAADATNALKKAVMSFDSLNILGNKKSGSLDNLGAGYDVLDDAIQQKTDSYMAKFNEEISKMESGVGKLGEKLKPVAEALSDFWEDLKPFSANVGEGLLWFKDNVLVPMSEIVIDETVPNFLYALESALTVVNTIADKFKKSKSDDTILGFLSGLQQSKLKDVSNWFKNIGDAFSELNEFIEKPNWESLLTYVKEVYNVAAKITGLPDLESFFKLTTDVFSDFDLNEWYEQDIAPWFTAEKWDETFSGIKDTITGWPDKIIEWFGDLKEKFVGKGKEVPSGIIQGWDESLENFSTWLKVRPAVIAFTFGKLLGLFVAKGKEILPGIRQGWNDSWIEFAEWIALRPLKIALTFGRLLGLFKTRGKDMGDGIEQGWDDGWEDFKTWLNGLPMQILREIGSLFSVGEAMIKSLIAGFKSVELPTVEYNGGESGSGRTHSSGVSSFENGGFVKQYATGGIQGYGELFIANENGPGTEFIGNLGNRHVVANNDMITTAMENASYNGYVRAFIETRSSSNKQSSGDVVLMVNDRELARAVNTGNQGLSGRYNPRLV